LKLNDIADQCQVPPFCAVTRRLSAVTYVNASYQF